MPSNKKTSKARSASKTSAAKNKSNIIKGGDFSSKKKFIFVSCLAIIAVAVVGYASTLGYQAYKQRKLVNNVKSVVGNDLSYNNIKAHAADLRYQYGTVMRFDTYGLIFACKYNNNQISVLMFRNKGAGSNSQYYVEGIIPYWYTSSIMYYSSPIYTMNWLSGVIALARTQSTVLTGHNYMGYAGTYFALTAYNTQGRRLDLVHRGAPRSEFGGRYIRSADGTQYYPRASDLPSCHY